MSYEEKVTSETITFASQEFGNIRVLDIDGQPWFVGKDVAAALGYVNTKQAIADHVDEDDKLKSDGVVIRDPMGRKQNPVIINESGLYSLILSSKLEGALKFKKWVTSEVLPSIRKSGRQDPCHDTRQEAGGAAAGSVSEHGPHCTCRRAVSGVAGQLPGTEKPMPHTKLTMTMKKGIM